jgi:chromate transport protein ChrA
LAAICYIVLLSAMDIIFAALEGDVLDHLLAGLVEMVVTILVPSLLVVVAFGLSTRSEQLTVGIVAGIWQLTEAIVFRATLNRAADASQDGAWSDIVGIALVLSFASVALGPWAIGRMRR